jgi:hypothetical protein
VASDQLSLFFPGHFLVSADLKSNRQAQKTALMVSREVAGSDP